MSFSLPKLPEGWSFFALEKCVQNGSISYGVVQPGVAVADGIPIIRVNNFQGTRIDLSEVMRISPKIESKYSRTRLVGGEVLLTLVGSVGQVAVVPKKMAGFNVARAVAVIHPQVHIDPEWIALCLRSPLSQHLLDSRANTTVQVTINLKDVRALPIPIPPEKERRQITEMFVVLDNRIALLRDTNTTLEAIAQTLFKSWFVDFDPVRAKQEGRDPEGIDADTAAIFPDSFEESELGLVPKGWQIKRLGDITERITKGTTPTTFKRPFVETGINFIKIESLTNDGEFIPEKFAYIDSETHELLKRSQLHIDDVLITIAGTIGRVVVMTEDFLPANTNQAVALIRPDKNIFPSGLIKRFLQRCDSRQSMVERVVQAVQANLSLGTISDLRVVVPPPEAVKGLYCAGIEQIDICKRMKQLQIRSLISIRDTLLPRLLSGQLRLSDAEALVDNAVS